MSAEIKIKLNKLPDAKYRFFMVQLARMFTSKDIEELKYILTSIIPAGKMESLDTTLKLFRHLEKLAMFGPENIGGLGVLEAVLRKLGKYNLCAMFCTFIEENRSNGERHIVGIL